MLLPPHRLLLLEGERCLRGQEGLPDHSRGRRLPDGGPPDTLRHLRVARVLGDIRGPLPQRDGRLRQAVLGAPHALHRGGGQVGAVPAARLAAGRHGGPDPGLRPDTRSDDGQRRALPGRAHGPVRRRGRPRGGRTERARPDSGLHRRDNGVHGRIHSVRPERHQEGAGLLDHEPAGIHIHGTRGRALVLQQRQDRRRYPGLRGSHVPPVQPRHGEGDALHGERLCHTRGAPRPRPPPRGRRARRPRRLRPPGHAEHGWPGSQAARDVGSHDDRLHVDNRDTPDRRVLVEGGHRRQDLEGVPGLRATDVRTGHTGPADRGHDGLLHVQDVVHDFRRGAQARGRRPRPRGHPVDQGATHHTLRHKRPRGLRARGAERGQVAREAVQLRPRPQRRLPRLQGRLRARARLPAR